MQLARLKGGARRIVRISEIVGVKDGAYQLEDVFGFEQTGLDDEGNAVGQFYATGYKPQCLARLKATGIELPSNTFDARRISV